MYRLIFLFLLAGCSTIELKADATYTKSTSVHKQDITDFYLSLPPPPLIISKQDAVFTAPPDANYQPLLDLLHTAPGGLAIQLNTLKTLTPYVLAIVPIIQKLTLQQVQNMTWQQAFAIPQIASAYFAAQSLPQLLGLWNQASLAWILANWQKFITPLQDLFNQLTATGSTFQPPDIISKVNPIEVITTINTLFKEKRWLELAEVGPDLLHSLVKHLGYVKPLIVLYGSKSKIYAPALWTKNGNTNYSINQEEGFQSHTLTEGFYQGDDDITLNYYPIVVKNKDVKVLDVISSERAILLKRMSGGNTNLLDRAETRNTSLLSLGLKGGGFTTRVVAGRTSYSELGGVTASWDVATEYLSNHISIGAVVEGDTFIGYAEEELTLRTPHLSVKGTERADLWGEVTLALSGTYPLQGDARVIPEVHTSVTVHAATIHTYAGSTFIVAPEGEVNLTRPDKSVRLVPVRYHVGIELRVAVSEHWSVRVDMIFEASELYQKAKVQAGVGYRWVTVTGMAEIRNERRRFGAGIDVGPVHVQGLWPDLFQAGVNLEF